MKHNKILKNKNCTILKTSNIYKILKIKFCTIIFFVYKIFETFKHMLCDQKVCKGNISLK